MEFAGLLFAAAVIGLPHLYLKSRLRLVRPGERLVVYTQGTTSRRWILTDSPSQPGGGRPSVLALPFLHRKVVRIQGDLVAPWDDVRAALRPGWELEPPRQRSSQGGWVSGRTRPASLRSKRPGGPKVRHSQPSQGASGKKADDRRCQGLPAKPAM